MEELDLLKKDWQKRQFHSTISTSEIYKMLKSKSSSIVKWIFIISVVEILFLSLLSFYNFSDSDIEMYEKYHVAEFFWTSTVIHYIVIFYFIYLFYKNYKSISISDSVKGLMNTILKTRKIVTYYIWYNLIGFIINCTVIALYTLKYEDKVHQISREISEKFSSDVFWLIMTVILIIVFLIFSIILWLFYKLLYGILLNRLHKNYKELQKMEL